MNRRPTDAEFGAWVEPLLGRAAAYAWSILRDRGDAEDAVQEGLWKAWRALDRYDRSRAFKGWWFAIIRNCCLDLCRRRSRHPTGGTDPDTLASDGDARQALERHDQVAWALSRLTPAHREVLQLRYFGDCSYREIAEALHIPAGTVMSRLHAARHALANALEKENV